MSYFTALGIINKITAGILLLAILPLPYAYYIFLRWAILISLVSHLFIAIRSFRKVAFLIFAVVGIIFNPIVPIYLSRTAWVFIDIFSALFVIIGFEDLEAASPRSTDMK